MKGFFVFLGMSMLGSWCVAQSSEDVFVPATTIRHANEKKGTMHTNYEVFKGKWTHGHEPSPMALMHGPAQSSTVQGYWPSDIRAAYRLNSAGGSGAIAIVDAFDLPTNLHDFNTFSSTFGLPTETSTNRTASSNTVFQVIYQGGTVPSSKGTDANQWGGEISLDMEWAHAIAPGAKIYLIECQSDDLTDLLAGVAIANGLSGVHEISMSFGGGEDPSELQLDSTFTTANKVYFSATGDSSGSTSYPATSPNVISVGGTSLDLSASDAVISEVGWNGESNGPSQDEPRPGFQSSVESVVGAMRGTPDVAADADPDTGCAVYNSNGISGASADPDTTAWYVFGGTSLACPICAGLTNLRGLFAASSQQELNRQYNQFAGTSYLRDITSGSSSGYSAMVGYDLVTGLGAPTGMYETANYRPSSISIINGTVVEGTIGSLAAIDGHDYVIRSVQASANTQEATVAGTFAGSLPSGTTLAVSLAVTAYDGSASCTISAYNPTTNAWVVVAVPTFGPNNTSQTITLANPAQFFGATGSMQFKIDAVQTGTTAFRLGLDYITLSTIGAQT